MEDVPEFLGWANVVLFGAVVAGGLLLRFGRLKAARPPAALAHRVLSFVAVASLGLHLALVEERPWFILIPAGALALLPLASIALKRFKKLKWAIRLKMAAVPLIAAALLAGHLLAGEGGNDNENGGHEPRWEQEHD